MTLVSKKKTWILVLIIGVVVVAAGVGIPLFLILDNSTVPHEVVNVSVHEAKVMMDDNVTYPDLVILDVRTDIEYAAGHLIDAMLLTWNSASSSFNGGESIIDSFNDTEILVYCQSGSRSALASQFLINHGFNKIINMLNGYNAWVAAGYATTTMIFSPTLIDLILIAPVLQA